MAALDTEEGSLALPETSQTIRRDSYSQVEIFKESDISVEIQVPLAAATQATDPEWKLLFSKAKISSESADHPVATATKEVTPKPHHDAAAETGKRRVLFGRSRRVSKYYQNLKKDQKILEEAEILGQRGEEEEGEGSEIQPLRKMSEDAELSFESVKVERRDRAFTFEESGVRQLQESTLKQRHDVTSKTVKEQETEEADRNTKSYTGQWRKFQCIQISVSTAARLSLSANFLLLFIKMAASVQSGSLSVISSLIDSVLDLFSGAAIATASYLMRHYNPYRYPIGRNRLEPVAIIITAAVMGTASLQIVTQAVQDVISDSINPRINGFSGSIIALTILIKGALYLLCFRVNSASVKALATDHRNDIVSNLAALIFGLLGTYLWKYLDTLGAVLLAVYIIVNWIAVGREQLKNLVGYGADRRFTSKLIYIALQHSCEIEKIDTVRAYTFGVNYLVEMHIVLSPDMPLERAHDIGESLQLKLESMDEVERAFVHLDFESEHSPSSEHIITVPDS